MEKDINKSDIFRMLYVIGIFIIQVIYGLNMFTTAQHQKNCQAFMNKLWNSKLYEPIRDLLFAWRDENKRGPVGIDTFMKIVKIIQNTEDEEKLLDYFNRCLLKDVGNLKNSVPTEKLKEIGNENPHALNILDNVYEWLKTDEKNVVEVPVVNAQPPKLPVYEELKDEMILPRLRQHQKFNNIAKVMQIYLKSIISIREFRELLSPLMASDASLFRALSQMAEEIAQKRRKLTIFAPLNELVDLKYPMEQVGDSYVLIPDGYANYGVRWKTQKHEYILNRKCVSVPLGSQGSFIIHKKTEYEQQLFNYEDQRYQLDSALLSLKSAIKIVQRGEKMDSPLLKRVVNEIYNPENVYNIFIKNSEVARTILLPRLIQKRDELLEIRTKFIKVCEEVSAKNFYKSLDYRCIYFAKNDKKFNCTQRWEKEVEMRKKQIVDKIDNVEEGIGDRQSLQHTRNYYINSFDNITKENFIENKYIQLKFDRKQNAVYPAFPHNQILFICNFENEDILNDVLEIILYFCTRKNLLELLVFKMLKKDIKRRLQKNSQLLNILETKEKIVNVAEIKQILNAEMEQEFPILNEQRSHRANRDSEEEFMDLIQEDLEPTLLDDLQSPFQGPDQHTFIGTKTCYLFLRSVTTIYQRFLKAKQYSERAKSPELYDFFLSIMIYRVKDKKTFEEYLRKLFCKDAFVFFTLDKMILGAAKLISNISTDSLTDRILKDLTKDYEYGLFDWDTYEFPSVVAQLTRLYHENEMLFRFTFAQKEKNIYISAWEPVCKPSEEGEIEETREKMQRFTTRYSKQEKKRRHHALVQDKSEEMAYNAEGLLVMKGERCLVSTNRQKFSTKQQLLTSLKRFTKMNSYIK